MRKSTTPSYGKRVIGHVSEKRIADMLKSNPLSPHFIVPTITDARSAVRLLLAEQAQYRYGNALDVLEYRVLVRNFGILLKKYSEEEVARAIVWATRVANNPSTNKHVEECILWLRQRL